jgi:hypothetical protein
MAECGGGNVIAHPALGLFRSQDVNLTTPLCDIVDRHVGSYRHHGIVHNIACFHCVLMPHSLEGNSDLGLPGHGAAFTGMLD